MVNLIFKAIAPAKRLGAQWRAKRGLALGEALGDRFLIRRQFRIHNGFCYWDKAWFSTVDFFFNQRRQQKIMGLQKPVQI